MNFLRNIENICEPRDTFHHYNTPKSKDMDNEDKTTVSLHPRVENCDDIIIKEELDLDYNDVLLEEEQDLFFQQAWKQEETRSDSQPNREGDLQVSQEQRRRGRTKGPIRRSRPVIPIFHDKTKWKHESQDDFLPPKIKLETVRGEHHNPVTNQEENTPGFHYWSAWDTTYRNRISCPLCKKKFSHSSVKVHLYSHLNPDEKVIVESQWEFQCYFCSKRFRAPSILTTHMQIHTEERPNQCKVCGKTYTRLSSLNVHKNSHSNKLSVRRQWECKICGDLFTVKSHLTIHLKYHKGLKEHGCKYCGKMFTHRSNLVIHVDSMHKGIRYKCRWCAISFTQKSTLTEHEKKSKRCLAKRSAICDKGADS